MEEKELERIIEPYANQRLTMKMVEQIKMLAKRNDALQGTIKAFEKRIEELEKICRISEE